MTKPRLFYYEPKFVRDTLRAAKDKATHLHQTEKELIEMLQEIDHRRFYVRLGYRSLRTFLIEGLKFTCTQAQRITTEARRKQTTSDIGPKDMGGPKDDFAPNADLSPKGDGVISTRYTNYFKSRGRWES